MAEAQPTKELVRKWYVVRAISGKEKKVKQYIEAEINRLKLNDYVSQVLIPTEKFYQIRNGKKVSKERNILPGYVLVEAALAGEIPHIIREYFRCYFFPWCKRRTTCSAASVRSKPDSWVRWMSWQTAKQ